MVGTGPSWAEEVVHDAFRLRDLDPIAVRSIVTYLSLILDTERAETDEELALQLRRMAARDAAQAWALWKVIRRAIDLKAEIQRRA